MSEQPKKHKTSPISVGRALRTIGVLGVAGAGIVLHQGDQSEEQIDELRAAHVADTEAALAKIRAEEAPSFVLAYDISASMEGQSGQTNELLAELTAQEGLENSTLWIVEYGESVSTSGPFKMGDVDLKMRHGNDSSTDFNGMLVASRAVFQQEDVGGIKVLAIASDGVPDRDGNNEVDSEEMAEAKRLLIQLKNELGVDLKFIDPNIVKSAPGKEILAQIYGEGAQPEDLSPQSIQTAFEDYIESQRGPSWEAAHPGLADEIRSIGRAKQNAALAILCLLITLFLVDGVRSLQIPARVRKRQAQFEAKQAEEARQQALADRIASLSQGADELSGAISASLGQTNPYPTEQDVQARRETLAELGTRLTEISAQIENAEDDERLDGLEASVAQIAAAFHQNREALEQLIDAHGETFDALQTRAAELNQRTSDLRSRLDNLQGEQLSSDRILRAEHHASTAFKGLIIPGLPELPEPALVNEALGSLQSEIGGLDDLQANTNTPLTEQAASFDARGATLQRLEASLSQLEEENERNLQTMSEYEGALARVEQARRTVLAAFLAESGSPILSQTEWSPDDTENMEPEQLVRDLIAWLVDKDNFTAQSRLNGNSNWALNRPIEPASIEFLTERLARAGFTKELPDEQVSVCEHTYEYRGTNNPYIRRNDQPEEGEALKTFTLLNQMLSLMVDTSLRKALHAKGIAYDGRISVQLEFAQDTIPEIVSMGGTDPTLAFPFERLTLVFPEDLENELQNKLFPLNRNNLYHHIVNILRRITNPGMDRCIHGAHGVGENFQMRVVTDHTRQCHDVSMENAIKSSVASGLDRALYALGSERVSDALRHQESSAAHPFTTPYVLADADQAYTADLSLGNNLAHALQNSYGAGLWNLSRREMRDSSPQNWFRTLFGVLSQLSYRVGVTPEASQGAAA